METLSEGARLFLPERISEEAFTHHQDRRIYPDDLREGESYNLIIKIEQRIGSGQGPLNYYARLYAQIVAVEDNDYNLRNVTFDISSQSKHVTEKAPIKERFDTHGFWWKPTRQNRRIIDNHLIAGGYFTPRTSESTEDLEPHS